MRNSLIGLVNSALDVAICKIKEQNKRIEELEIENKRLNHIIEKFALKQLKE